MADGRQLTIIKVFRKYSHSLGPDALQLLEEILERHDIADNEVEFSIETIAREYNKQDDAAMKVSLDILRRVYDALQDQGNPGEAEELLDPDSHLYFVDAFEMPSWHWSQERGTFEKSSNALTVAGSADSRIAASSIPRPRISCHAQIHKAAAW